ncbi:MAG: endolytic transglycosylase MltG [Methyloceanibacter sp.]|uniref:endolytic transglycosylase MltG n=1 Tax=Methyloceanibacter sp. TaxID=1965321 RepID=UPI003D9BEE21
MSLTSDYPPTANGNDGRGNAGHKGHALAILPRSPAEALEPMRPPDRPERPERARDKHPFLSFLSGMLTLACLMLVAALGVVYFVKVQFDRPGPLKTSTVIVVPKGEGVSAIAERLEREHVIGDRRVFMTSVLYFMYLRGQGSLKAGEYEFDKYASIRQVLDTLVEGRSIEHKVTLAEGLTSQQIVERLLAHPELKGTIAQIPAEGTLLPDTYKFGGNDTRQDIIERMQAAQAKFLATLWDNRDQDLMISTPQEALILASIVEKETSRADERPRIASVFHNRLRKKMRLQSDPTIIYGLVKGVGVLDHPITQDELDRETEYNTYKINGLPPTPIATPGRAAIEAVLRPAKTSDLYFVADGTGSHAFAPSLDAHNKNVAKWRAIERERRAREAEQATAAAANAPPVDASTSAAAETGAVTLPDALVTVAGETAATGATESPADAGEAVPLPKRNPKR